jgi:CheY-like chemotaxis protein
MVKKMMLAEFDDVAITESDAGLDALYQLAAKRFELLISECQLTDMPVTELQNRVKTHSINKDTQVIVLGGDDADEKMDRLAETGLLHWVETPIDAGVLIGKINEICDPRKWRETERFHIPDSKAVLNVWGMEAGARLINISLGGVLIEVSGDRSELLLQNDPKITLRIKSPGDYYDIKDLPCRLTRLDVIEWDNNHKPIAMRAAYVFLELNSTSRMELEQLIMMAKEKAQYAVEGMVE